MKVHSILIAAGIIAGVLQGPAAARVDALTAHVITDDADRFAKLFDAAGGHPTAEALQKGYLAPGTEAIGVFTPYRIKNAKHLAEVIAQHPDEYRRAIDVCLPIAKDMSGELRAVYLAYEGLFGDPDLPKIYTVFGADNSGGTAAPGVQVIGLEVICRDAKTDDEIRSMFRTFFAHEALHAMQPEPDETIATADPMLVNLFYEGAADFFATMVTGAVPKPERAAWARPREAELWAEFERDRAAVKALPEDQRDAKGSPFFRWFADAGSPPEGWPGELGYWVGMRICEAYFDAAKDKRAAVRDLLELKDMQKILDESGYAKRFAAQH